MPESLSTVEVRRLAIGAAGLNDATRSFATAIARLRILQLDAIKVTARAHELALCARVPGTTADDVTSWLWSQAQPVAFEYWAHAASLVPIEDWPLWSYRRDSIKAAQLDWAPVPELRARILDQLEAEGPQGTRQLRRGEAPSAGWGWGPLKEAVEHMVWTGEIICARRAGWERVFDLPTRVLPERLLDRKLDPGEGRRTLVQNALSALGVATTKDVADYLRMPENEAASTLSELATEQCVVDGWADAAWIAPDAFASAAQPLTRPIALSPFDNLIWHRPRVQRLFGFAQTFEAYKPAAKRKYGYYACPILADDQLIARVDAKIEDRTLVVKNLVMETGRESAHDDAIEAAISSLAESVGAEGVLFAATVGRPVGSRTEAMRST